MKRGPAGRGRKNAADRHAADRPSRPSRPAPGGSRPTPKPPPEGRIQKVLAAAGAGSRRRIEDWIREGKITVNGEPAFIGQAIGPSDRVKIEGRSIALGGAGDPRRVLAYKKRVGEIVTREDPEGRRTVFRKLPRLQRGRWIAVGRLDLNTSGLLLFTNDGELARRLMHPSFEIEREYAVRVLGEVDDALLETLRRGVQMEDGEARFERVWRVDGEAPEEGETGAANRWFHVIVRQGRHRLVRRLWEAQGCQVSRLIRVRYGPVELGRGVRSADWRELEADEIRELVRTVQLE
ncbi:MAG TPA: pseudouridine synthase [Candidatus Binatia bacterium]|nr:pseudouridine synthase [Candidatus Binatia bacterium]